MPTQQIAPARPVDFQRTFGERRALAELAAPGAIVLAVQQLRGELRDRAFAGPRVAEGVEMLEEILSGRRTGQ